MGRRILSTIFTVSVSLLAGQTAFAGTVDFQSAVSQDAQGGGTQTSQGGGGASVPPVQTVDFGEVTGTVCDCGEIEPAGPSEAAPSRGFPKFPLLALAAAPGIICLTGICERPTPTPTPMSSVPEPVTVTMFAAGLASLAGLRSRRRRS